ncbi:hypothetical protein [Paraliobacillus ryukyuensis]|uniref:hypothetical protein n=1 Tax=Paraliobacillus ryukyuensis TaxID=200904 RepID=UPI0009A8274A|nr:hypothetical protein [Paraliobacillus ryukyuensis]
MNEKNNKFISKDIKISLIVLSVPVIIGIIILFTIVDSGVNYNYDNNPSIHDEEFIKDNYGGISN